MALHHYFITGTSSGIGKAIAEQLIQREDHFVTGLSRTCSITHPRYEHFALDLADQKQVNEWKPLTPSEAKPTGGTLEIGSEGRIDAGGTLPISVK